MGWLKSIVFIIVLFLAVPVGAQEYKVIEEVCKIMSIEQAFKQLSKEASFSTFVYKVTDDDPTIFFSLMADYNTLPPISFIKADVVYLIKNPESNLIFFVAGLNECAVASAGFQEKYLLKKYDFKWLRPVA